MNPRSLQNFWRRLDQSPYAWLLALTGGVIASFGFAPYAFRSALWLGLILLFCLTVSGPGTRAAWRGGAFGVGYFGLGVYWIYHSVHVYAFAPIWLAVILTLLLVLYLAAYIALAAGLAARFFAEGHRRMFALAALLALGEWVRGVLLSGFPWILTGQASLDSPWAGYLPIFGVYGTGLLMMVSVAGLALILRQTGSMRSKAAMVGLIGLLGVGGQMIEWSKPQGPLVSFGAVQANLDPLTRWKRGGEARIQARYRVLTKQAADTAVLIWPEAAIPKIYSTLQAFYKEITQQVLNEETTLLTGAFYRAEESAPPRNGLINVTTGQRYGKRHLVPFGEYTPLEQWLAPIYQRMHIQMRNLDASEDRPVLQVQDLPVGVSICYESVYPNLTRDALPQAAYLVNVSNDAWFGDTRGPWQHLEASRLRAAETARDMVRVANTGVTAMIGADGAITQIAPRFEAVVLKGEVQPRQGVTPYVRWGDWPFWLLAVLILILSSVGSVPFVSKKH